MEIYFNQVSETSFWFEQSQFRLTLVYLSINNIDEAKKILNQISNSPNMILSKQATELLAKI